MYYEVTLNWNSNGFTVNPELGEGWSIDSDLIHEAAMGYPVREISEKELPARLINPTFAGLRLFRMEAQNGPSFFGIVDR